MKLLLVICAFVVCASAATVYKIRSHLDVTKEFISSSDDNPLDFLDSNEIEQLTSNDLENELSKKRQVNKCHLCHQVVGFVIHHTHNRTSNQSVARTLKYVCNHFHHEHQSCLTFVGNYSMSITNMIVANKSSFQICNKLGSCKHRVDDEMDQVLSTTQQTHLVLNNAENKKDDEEVLDSTEDDDGVDYSQINTGGVEPDYEFHENRVGNDDSHDDDRNNQVLMDYEELTDNEGDVDDLDTNLHSEDAENEDPQNFQNEVTESGELCKICKIVVTSVLSKTTPKSSKLDIKEVLDSSCRHVIPIFKEKCKKLLSGFESKIIVGIFNNRSSKEICTIDLKNMCSIGHFDDIIINDDNSLQFDINEDDFFPNVYWNNWN